MNFLTTLTLIVVLAFFTHEKVDPSGMIKVCYYTSTLGEYHLTIRATQLCPVMLELKV